jgi:hypothetical protein
MGLPARTRRSIGALLLALLAAQGSFAAEDHAASELKGTWSGTFNQYSHNINDSFAVKLTVDAISGNEFTGKMEWPTFDTTTKVKGMVEGSLIKWIETGYLKGEDAVLNGLYVAHFTAANEITGDWMDPKHTITPKGPRFGTRGADFVLKKE